MRSVVVLIVAVFFSSVCWYLLTSEAMSRLSSSEKMSNGHKSTCWVLSNGVHTGILLPSETADHNFKSWVGTPDALNSNFVSFGWGDKGFFIDTPTWADLEAEVAVKALFAKSASAMHVTYYQELPDDAYGLFPLEMDENQLDKLCRYIKSSFVVEDGQVIRIEGPSYPGRANAFYEAKGSYSCITTCNEWTRKGLIEAGMEVPSWTPFEWQLVRGLKN